MALALVAGCAQPGFPDPHEASDWVAFTKEQQEGDSGGVSAEGIVAPGSSGAGDLDAFWLGPTAFRRHAIFSVSEELNLGAGSETSYATVYQERRFGCSSNYLPGLELAPDYRGPGNSLDVQNWPAGSGAAREEIRWFESLGDAPMRGRTASGEAARILGFDGHRSGLIVGDTFVVIDATAEKTESVLDQLRPVGD